MVRPWVKLALGAALAVSAPAAYAQDNVVNIYNWADYIGPNVVSGFEKASGIKVNYDTFDAEETVEAKLSAGDSGYDLTVPTLTPFLQRGIKAGLYQKIDKSKLKNWGNLDPELLKMMDKYDPGNQYAIPWVLGEEVLVINVDAVKKIWPDAPLDSWSLLLDPKNLAKFKGCGVEFLDSPTEVMPVVMMYLGLDPNSTNPADLQKATDRMMELRPYIRKFDSINYANDMASGDACLAFGWSGDMYGAVQAAQAAHEKFKLIYVIPREGSVPFMDTLAIPADAPHYDNALKFLDWVMRPDMAADTANTLGARVGESAAKPLIHKDITGNPAIYPPPAIAAKLVMVGDVPEAFDQQRTRDWTKIKTGE